MPHFFFLRCPHRIIRIIRIRNNYKLIICPHIELQRPLTADCVLVERTVDRKLKFMYLI